MDIRTAIDGFILFKSGEGLSQNTLLDYGHWLGIFARRYDGRDVGSFRPADISGFLDYLRNEYEPRRLTGGDGPLSSQSVRNAWVALKSFYRWASSTLDIPNVMADGRVPSPKATNPEQVPFSEDEVRAMLAAIVPKRSPRATSGTRYVEALRDRAMILTLLDTGVRAAEFCAFDVGDLTLKTGRIIVERGKGGRGRHVWVGDVTRPAIWQYLQERPDGSDPAAPLFASHGNRLAGSRLTPHSLHKRLAVIGKRAGVADVYPHKFRHTFAIFYLRNGGDVFTLQALLGHSSLTMVQRYLKLSSSDTESAHRRNSPVDRWLK